MEGNPKKQSKIGKKVLLAFVGLSIFSILCPIVYQIFLPKFGRINYIVDEKIFDYEGETEQIGRAGSLATPITLEPHAGYKFVSWSDRKTEAQRQDVFASGKKQYTALGGFATTTIPNINIKSPYLVSSSKTKMEIVDDDVVFQESAKRVDYLTDFENSQGQSKWNFYLTLSPNRSFFGSRHYKAYSSFYDKTLYRQIFGLSLYNSLFEEMAIDFFPANVFFDSVFYGVYVFVSYDFLCGSEKTFVFNKSAAEKTSSDFEFDNRKYDYVFESPRDDAKICDVLTAMNNGKNYCVDGSSFVRRAVLEELMKNNSAAVNDAIMSLNENDELAVSPIDSLALSSGLFRYYDYSPVGEVVLDPTTKKVISDLDLSMDYERYVSQAARLLKDNITELYSRISAISDAIYENNKKYPVKSVFATPFEIADFNYSQHLAYFKQWMDERVEWLLETYSTAS